MPVCHLTTLHQLAFGDDACFRKTRRHQVPAAERLQGHVPRGLLAVHFMVAGWNSTSTMTSWIVFEHSRISKTHTSTLL